jgi:ATP-dependent DNA helicase RecQ
MVATNAFGMGIDKSNVSFVIHYNMPKSMEAYYQEAGRAGRDGTEADCILLFNRADIRTAEFLINNGSENEELDPPQREMIRQQDLRRLDVMVAYCQSSSCLRGYILEYFGQTHPEVCGKCGTCQTEFEIKDITKEAQMLLSCVKRVRDKLGYSVGITIIGRVLRGSKDHKILEQGLHKLSTYGLLPGKSRTEIRSIAGFLEAEDYLETEPEHQTLRLTPKAAEILYQGKTVQMPVRKEPEPISIKGSTPVALPPMDADLYDVLRALRAKLAQESKVPAYVIFSNATLQDMAQKKPKTVTEFKRVSGVGELKATWYAKPFLEAIKQFQLTAE